MNEDSPCLISNNEDLGIDEVSDIKENLLDSFSPEIDPQKGSKSEEVSPEVSAIEKEKMHEKMSKTEKEPNKNERYGIFNNLLTSTELPLHIQRNSPGELSQTYNSGCEMLITDDSKDLIREEPQDRIILDDESLESTLLSNKDLISPKVNVTGGIPDRVVEFKLEEGETLVSDVRVPLLELKPRITEISEPKIQDIGVDEKVDFVVDSIMESLLNEINDNMIPPK